MDFNSINGVKILIKFLAILVSSFAFLIVALLTAIAGYALVAPEFSLNYLLSHGLSLIITYSLLLWPYYASRHGLLERTLPRVDRPLDIDSIRYGIEYPVYIAILVLIVAFYTFGYSFFQPEFFGQLREISMTIFLGLVPFFVVFATSLRNLVSDNKDKAFQFSERVLYPALCTGIIPFSFGWSIGGGTINLSIIIAGTFYVIALIIIAKIRESGELGRVSAIIVITLILFIATMREEFKSIILGTVILLAMGVSEASKRVYQAKIKDRYYPDNQGQSYYLAGSNWTSIVFLWLLCIVPLIINELPTYPFLIFVTTQSLFWFFTTDLFKSSKTASIISLLFGYALPLIIIFARAINISITFLPASIKPTDAIAVYGIISAFAFVFLGPDFRNYILSRLKFENTTYLNRKYNYYLFFIVIAAIMIIAIGIGTYSVDSQTKTKATEIITAGSLVTVLLLASYFIQDQTNGTAKDNNMD